MDRAQDLKDKAEALQNALDAGDGQAIAEAAGLADLALQFRESDEIAGIEPIDAKLRENVDGLVDRALAAAVELGQKAAYMMIAERRINKGDLDEAYAAALDGARAGDVAAATLTAKLARQGCAPDPATAVQALEPLADEPSGQVALQLGYLRFNGIGCDEDKTASLALHETAAERGQADSMFELYAMYANGLGCEADVSRANSWCQRAAEAGNMRAMSNLGGMYATGNGVEHDVQQSLKWYDAAARAGHGRAATVVGIMYAEGDDIPQDKAKAKEYFALAEEADFPWEDLADAVGLDVEEYMDDE